MSNQSEPVLRPEVRGTILSVFNDSNNIAMSVQFEGAWSKSHNKMEVVLDRKSFSEGKGILPNSATTIPGGKLSHAVICDIPESIMQDKPIVEISYINAMSKKRFMHILILDSHQGKCDIRRGRISNQAKREAKGSSQEKED
jgi:hypothetical protein